ncbi:MAG: protocatechuate 3,4-dioxygenase beta subunit [Pseudohongiellaceae bacterium]
MRDQTHQPPRQPQGSSAVSLLVAILVITVIGIALTYGWISSDSASEAGGASAVVAASSSNGAGAAVPGLLAGAAEDLAVDPSLESDGLNSSLAQLSDALSDELTLDYPRTTIQGRVVLLGPGDMPSDMTIKASLWKPKPHVDTLNISMIRDEEPRADFLSIEDSSLGTRTRVPVQKDGRFEMPDFPLDSAAWLELEHPQWYQATSQLYEIPSNEDAEGAEFVVEATRGAILRGTIQDAEGQPVQGVTITGGSKVDPYAILEGTSLFATVDPVTSDQDGRFEIAPAPSNVPLILKTSADLGYQSTDRQVAGLSPGQVAEEILVVLRGGTIEGLVLDDKEQPVAQTRVQIQATSISISDMGSQGETSPDRIVSTDDAGRFAFTSLKNGGYRLALYKGGFRPTATETIEVLPGQVVSEVILVADRGLSVAGRVLGTDGEPVNGAMVKGFLPPAMFSMRSMKDKGLRAKEDVDDQGHFTLWGYEEGEIRVEASASGYVSNSLDVAAGASDFVITIKPKRAITGIAIDLSSGDPLTDYQLRLLPAEASMDMSAMMEIGDKLSSLPAPLEVSDDEGRFTMEDVTPGLFSLMLMADGYAQTLLPTVEVTEGSGASGVIIMVSEESSVTGQVVSGRTGQGIPGAKVTTGKTDAMNAWKQMFSGPVQETTTLGDGLFELGGLGDDPVTLTIQDQDHREVVIPNLALRPGQTYDIGLVTLPPGGTIHGTVYGPDARPESGVPVMVSDVLGKQMKRTKTENDGTYVVSGLNAGTFNVIRLDFSLSLGSDNPANMVNDLTIETVELELDAVQKVDLGAPHETGCLLEGVVMSSGGPEEDAMVVVVREDGPPGTKFSGTDENGHYSIKGIKPGDYLVQVIPSGTTVGGGSQPSTPTFSTVTIGDEARRQHDIDIPGAVLRGETRSQTGERLSGIRVLLERSDDGRPRSRFIESMGGRVGEAYSDKDGIFSFEHLPAGTYTLQAGGTNMMGMGKKGWAITRVSDIAVREGSEGFKQVIELDEGGAVSGIVLGPEGKPVADVPIWARNNTTGRWLSTLSEVTSDAGGHYTVNSLESGSWTLAFGGDNWALTLLDDLSVRQGEVDERDVHIERGVEIFAELGPFLGRQLTIQLAGPQGAVPTQLTSISTLMSGSNTQPNRRRLGRLPTGNYSVAVFEDGKSVFTDTVRLKAGGSEVTVSLEEGND